ncbi:hypothetical protein L345_07828, partial [Ophiophagus hannah]
MRGRKEGRMTGEGKKGGKGLEKVEMKKRNGNERKEWREGKGAVGSLGTSSGLEGTVYKHNQTSLPSSTNDVTLLGHETSSGKPPSSETHPRPTLSLSHTQNRHVSWSVSPRWKAKKSSSPLLRVWSSLAIFFFFFNSKPVVYSNTKNNKPTIFDTPTHTHNALLVRRRPGSSLRSGHLEWTTFGQDRGKFGPTGTSEGAAACLEGDLCQPRLPIGSPEPPERLPGRSAPLALTEGAYLPPTNGALERLNRFSTKSSPAFEM